MTFDMTTMPLDEAFNWDPNSIVGRAITREPWKNVPWEEKSQWIAELNSNLNVNTFVSKLMDFEAFMAIIVRQDDVLMKIIMLEDFQRFIQGPILYGPYNWPDPRK